MSAIVATNRGGICGICQEGFGDRDQQITHVGGERHDGFHKICLTQWVVVNPTCPYDGQYIDPNSLISRTDQIMATLRPALTNAAYAACFGAAVGTIGAGIEAATGNGSLGSIGAASAVVYAGATIATIATFGMAQAVATVAGVIGIGIVGGITGVGTVRVVVAGLVAGIGIDRILNHREVGQIDRDSIGFGIAIGAAGALAGVFTPLAIPPAIALVGGVAAGVLSLIR